MRRTTVGIWIVAIALMATIQPAGATEPECEATGYVDRCATTTEAFPPVADIDEGQTYLSLTARVTETATEAPLEGLWVEFTAPSAIGSTSICSAMTDAEGVASCDDLGAVATATAGRRLVAQFHGTGTYLPSSASAPPVRALGNDLP